MKLGCAATDTHRKMITSITAVLLPSVTYLLTLPRTLQLEFRYDVKLPHVLSETLNINIITKYCSSDIELISEYPSLECVASAQ
jgi:hypothetical protein